MSENEAAITRLHVSETSHNQLTSIACVSAGLFCPKFPVLTKFTRWQRNFFLLSRFLCPPPNLLKNKQKAILFNTELQLHQNYTNNVFACI